MTTLGKILVIVILLLSLVEGALLLQVYQRRTDWSAAYNQLKGEFDVAQKNTETFQDRLKAQEDRYETEIKALKESNQTLDAKNKQLDNDLIAERNRVKEQENKGAQAEINVRVATEEKERRKKEWEAMQATLQQREQTILKLEDDSKKNRQAFITADVELKSTRERNAQLLAQNQELMKEVERLRSGSSIAQKPAGAGSSKPPEDVEGSVTEVDAKAGLITISLGSDSGLAKGNTLEVYRLKPEPKYLGRIMLLDVRHHQAVAKPVGNPRQAQIQIGDKVATNIVAGR